MRPLPVKPAHSPKRKPRLLLLLLVFISALMLYPGAGSSAEDVWPAADVGPPVIEPDQEEFSRDPGELAALAGEATREELESQRADVVWSVVDGVLRVTEISLFGRQVSGRLNLEPFPCLKKFAAFATTLSSANVSKNDELDLAQNLSLAELNLEANQTSRLFLPESDRLKMIDADDNKLAAIDLGGCPALESLRVGRNLLGALDVSKNPELRDLRLFGNQVGTLCLSGNGRLESLAA
ncbi:MAG: hypothetical protein LBP95_11885, partial [Deltaproteobacteria bacterium]|nr:hypothetical protein [Deltaproteobacteria bacterium]